MSNLEKKIISLISAHLGVLEEEITLESSFKKDLGAETLVIANLLAKIQEQLNLDLESINPEEVETVNQLISIITDQNPDFD